MNRVKLREAGIDSDEAIQRLRGKKALYEKFLNTFVNDEHYARMIQAIADGDMAEAYYDAHALKGMSGNLSMNRLYERLIPLVEQLKAGEQEQIPELLAPVTVCYHDVIAAIRN